MHCSALVEQGVLGHRDFLPWTANTLEIFELGGRVVERVDLVQFILTLVALYMLRKKTVFVREFLLILLVLDLAEKAAEVHLRFLAWSRHHAD